MRRENKKKIDENPRKLLWIWKVNKHQPLWNYIFHVKLVIPIITTPSKDRNLAWLARSKSSYEPRYSFGAEYVWRQKSENCSGKRCIINKILNRYTPRTLNECIDVYTYYPAQHTHTQTYNIWDKMYVVSRCLKLYIVESIASHT